MARDQWRIDSLADDTDGSEQADRERVRSLFNEIDGTTLLRVCLESSIGVDSQVVEILVRVEQKVSDLMGECCSSDQGVRVGTHRVEYDAAKTPCLPVGDGDRGAGDSLRKLRMHNWYAQGVLHELPHRTYRLFPHVQLIAGLCGKLIPDSPCGGGMTPEVVTGVESRCRSRYAQPLLKSVLHANHRRRFGKGGHGLAAQLREPCAGALSLQCFQSCCNGCPSRLLLKGDLRLIQSKDERDAFDGLHREIGRGSCFDTLDFGGVDAGASGDCTDLQP